MFLFWSCTFSLVRAFSCSASGFYILEEKVDESGKGQEDEGVGVGHGEMVAIGDAYEGE